MKKFSDEFWLFFLKLQRFAFRISNDTNGIIGGPTRAIGRLGMKRTTLQAWIKKLGIARPG
jgi:hypothetical protein